MMILAWLALAVTQVTIPGPKGPLAGTLMTAAEKDAPVVVIVPGSGPTDRDGNSPLGVTAAPYRLLAEALADRGVSTLRIDKRGLFGSKAAADPNAVTIADYAGDVRGWAAEATKRTGRGCAWLLGHSEGALIALKAAQDPRGICGVVLVAGPGRPLGDVLREQLRANPANAPILPAALAAIDALEAGKRVDMATLPTPLHGLFNAPVQGFLIDLFAHDPAKLAGGLTVPLMIVQGGRDTQVSIVDAERLKAAAPRATLALLPGVNHVLKQVGDDPAANRAAYADPSLPVAPALVEAVARFVRPRR